MGVSPERVGWSLRRGAVLGGCVWEPCRDPRALGGVCSWAGRRRNIKARELPPLGIVLIFSPRNQTRFLDASKRNKL